MNAASSPVASDDGEKPLLKRALQLVVSICLMTGVTVILGYGGGLLLTILAALGGPNPETEDGDLLKDRLLAWPERNREFMKNNGKGNLPWTP